MRLVGIDPGPQKCAWALVELSDAGRPRWLAVGMVDSTPEAFAREDICAGASLVAIERPEFFAGLAFSANPLFDTCWVGGGIAWAAAGRGLRVATMTARQWRGEICRKANASDAAIAIAVEDLVGELGPSKSHERDAIGVAIAVGWREIGRRVQLSGMAEMRLLQQLAAEQAKRTTKMRAKRAANATATGKAEVQ